jgi:hypothetical protein
MATPSEKLAESLEVLHKLQNANGAAAIRARDLTRTHRERPGSSRRLLTARLIRAAGRSSVGDSLKRLDTAARVAPDLAGRRLGNRG